MRALRLLITATSTFVLAYTISLGIADDGPEVSAHDDAADFEEELNPGYFNSVDEDRAAIAVKERTHQSTLKLSLDRGRERPGEREALGMLIDAPDRASFRIGSIPGGPVDPSPEAVIKLVGGSDTAGHYPGDDAESSLPPDRHLNVPVLGLRLARLNVDLGADTRAVAASFGWYF